MQIITETLSLKDLKITANNLFGDMVKAVVDIDKRIIAIDAELHSDLEALLLSEGSLKQHLWGINLYPDLKGEDFLEFNSMINIRPSQGNMSRGVNDKELQKKIIEVVIDRIKEG